MGNKFLIWKKCFGFHKENYRIQYFKKYEIIMTGEVEEDNLVWWVVYTKDNSSEPQQQQTLKHANKTRRYLAQYRIRYLTKGSYSINLVLQRP